MKIKSKPEDFIVKEYPEPKTNEGIYLICLLKKRNYTTQRAIEHISKVIHCPIKNISISGTKDKYAITEQYISIRNVKKDQINSVQLKDIELSAIGFRDKPLAMGEHEGNDFTITVRNSKTSIIQERIMPNYYGEQRFSKYNKKIGKCIVKKEFKDAIAQIAKSESDYYEKMESSLKKNPTDYITALRIIPNNILRLYIHAYQSLLWNRTRAEYKGKEKIPIIGFGTEIDDDELKKIIEQIMKEEKISKRDFIIKQIPHLSAVGGERDTSVEIHDLKQEKKSDVIILSY